MERSISLTHGLSTLIDDADFGRVSAFAWRAWWDPKANAWYALRHAQIGSGHATRKTGVIYLARFIMQVTCWPEPWDGVLIDHIEHANLYGPASTLDNRRSNLRRATHQQNSQNRYKKRSKFGFKGVRFSAHRANRGLAPYQAYIGINGRFVHLGIFVTPEEAAAAYDAAAIKHFGDYALING